MVKEKKRRQTEVSKFVIFGQKTEILPKNNEWMNGVLRHVDSYIGHVVRASNLMDDMDIR